MTWSSRRPGGIRCRRCAGRSKVVRTLAQELSDQGHPVSASKVGQLLAPVGLLVAGQRQGDRGGPASRPRRPVPLPQRQAAVAPRRRPAGDQRRHQEEGADRAITPTGARNSSPKGEPERVDVHDFADPEVGKAIPYRGLRRRRQRRLVVRRRRRRHRRVRGRPRSAGGGT